ncbi:hypothetical protein BDN71DRAFT_1482540 [Pleurotus eryngii]|uniref:Tafazzin family protein n=1 Tax=Pleurotus eryngii TaxID=5323 RepID=A0A9P5ZWE9_PLEER|nr:hypothetical protein BDN71DRAFT_1482540 [Pleurotus eryngii]
MGLLSTATIATIGLGSKVLLHAPGSCSLTVNGLDILTKALDSGRSVITVANHISTVDDPIAWGILPTRYYLRSRTMRWALGASDIMFTNPVFSKFFRLGQVHETFRGEGIYQPAVDAAINTLNTTGGWVHLFGEGKINQPPTYPINPITRKVHLPRFKWGVIATSPHPPLIIPMWLSGFDNLMPEGRSSPWRFIPRFFASPQVPLGITFGEAVEGEDIVRAGLKGARVRVRDGSGDENLEKDVARVRREITAVVQKAVEDLGRKVDGEMLGRVETAPGPDPT